MKDGMIDIDSVFGTEVGFTGDKFISSWLWKTGDDIWFSMIMSKEEGKGNLRNLITNIFNKGYGIIIPTPSNRMVEITTKMGFEHVLINTEDGEMDAMIKDPKSLMDVPKASSRTKKECIGEERCGK